MNSILIWNLASYDYDHKNMNLCEITVILPCYVNRDLWLNSAKLSGKSLLLYYIFHFNHQWKGDTYEPDSHASEQRSVKLIWPLRFFGLVLRPIFIM